LYRLCGLVCFYGCHYVAFMFSKSSSSWLFFNDESIGKVGIWSQVVRKCISSKYQPTLLLYEQISN